MDRGLVIAAAVIGGAVLYDIARRRKGLLGFEGTPNDHAYMLREEIESMNEIHRNLENTTDKGNCGKALDLLKQLDMHGFHAGQNIGWLLRSIDMGEQAPVSKEFLEKTSDNLEIAHGNATDTFEQVCQVKVMRKPKFKKKGKKVIPIRGLSDFQVQVAPKLHTAACRADKGGWSKSWATVHTNHSHEGASSYLTKLKGKYRGDRCVKFRITGR